jgi:hypothetical protein
MNQTSPMESVPLCVMRSSGPPSKFQLFRIDLNANANPLHLLNTDDRVMVATIWIDILPPIASIRDWIMYGLRFKQIYGPGCEL